MTPNATSKPSTTFISILLPQIAANHEVPINPAAAPRPAIIHPSYSKHPYLLIIPHEPAKAPKCRCSYPFFEPLELISLTESLPPLKILLVPSIQNPDYTSSPIRKPWEE